MAKKRVYEVAKEFEMSSKEFVRVLNSYDISVKSHMSTLEDQQVEWIKKKLNNDEASQKSESFKKSKDKTKKPSKDEGAKTEKTPVKESEIGKVKKEKEEENSKAPDQKKKQEVENMGTEYIGIKPGITVEAFAKKLGVKPSDVIKALIDYGIMATINEKLDFETASVVAEEFGFHVREEAVQDIDNDKIKIPLIEDAPESLEERPPIVTVMGHVDHGKTSVLDAIRHTKVTEKEAGGITQHIGAYQAVTSGKEITFIDTPGHEAFTAMRARGAQCTDIAVLVCAADDGVMPQTIEAINHAKAAGIPIIVAVNKIDRPNANPEKVKQQLIEHGLVPEEWGGETVCVEVSAVKHEGLDQLLEMILLVAEMEELKANPNRNAEGIVIESELDKGKGPVATVIVQNGTLKIGNSIAVGPTFGRVRSMMDDKGQKIEEAGPSKPVQIQGFAEVPQVGERFNVVDDKTAKLLSERRKEEQREKKLQQRAKVNVDDLFKQLDESEKKQLKVIIKADVQGSAEALRQSLERIDSDEVKVDVIHIGVGSINETDIMLASASEAIVIGFNVRPDTNAKNAAENEGVEIRMFRVIYEAIEEVRRLMSGLLEPEYKEVVLGRAEIRAVFKVPKVGSVAGCYMLEGKVTNKSKVRVIRDGAVIYEGELSSLKRFKDDVKEVEQGYECGIGVENFNDIKEHDILEFYIIEEHKRNL